MTIIKKAENLCRVLKSEEEFESAIGTGRTLAFILKDHSPPCNSLIENLVSGGLKDILDAYGIRAVYLDLDNKQLANTYQEQEVYCVPFVMAFQDGERVGLCTSNIPFPSFLKKLEEWYEI